MITIDFTVREAMYLANHWAYNNDSNLYDKIVNAISAKCGENANNIRLVVHSMMPDKMIQCIKALRLATGWGLKDSKDFFDVVRGRYHSDSYSNTYSYRDGKPNSLVLTNAIANQLMKELHNLGCVVTTESA